MWFLLTEVSIETVKNCEKIPEHEQITFQNTLKKCTPDDRRHVRKRLLGLLSYFIYSERKSSSSVAL